MAEDNAHTARLQATPLFRQNDLAAARRVISGVYGDDTDSYDHYLLTKDYGSLGAYLRGALDHLDANTASHPDVVATNRLLGQVEAALGR